MRLFIVALLTSIISAPSFAQASSIDEIKAPVVVELFTSQSCSSCPPADKLLGKIAKNENIITLSCHVTYWNHLHWKDTLSKEFCTERQKNYSRAMKKRGPYTPQMIINGTHDVVGNRRGQVTNLIEKTSKQEALLPVEITKSGNILNIEIPKTTQPPNNVSVLLFSYKNQHKQTIPNGENSGKTVNYTTPVRDVVNLGTWDGAAQTITRKSSHNNQGYAVIIQENGHGRIIGAGKLDL